jgi:hypothetical protein
MRRCARLARQPARRNATHAASWERLLIVDVEAELLAFARRVLAETRPSRLLLIGPAAAGLAADYRAAEPGADVQTLDVRGPESLEQLRPVDLAIVMDALERLPHTAAAALLGQLRDLYARRIVATLRTDATASWGHRDMIGHGFVRLSNPGAPARVYEFDIGTYKTTPDWLGSKDWANPQLFDKYRW